MDKKRLIIFQPLIGPYRVDLTNDLCEVFNTRVYLTYPDCEGLAFQQQEIVKQLHFTPTYLPAHSLFQLLNTLKKVIKAFSPDIILTSEFDETTLFVLVWRWLTRGKYKIVSLCDDSYDMLTGNDSTRSHKMARRLIAKHLDNIVSVEPKAVDWYRQKYGIGFFFPIIRDEELAVNLYKEALPLLNDTRERFHLTDRYIFLYVGRLVSIKNVSVLVDAYSAFDQSENKLVIVGDGQEMGRLKRQAEELGIDVLFLGRLDGPSLYVWYLIAHSFILPSLQEPFGAVTNEALIGGCCAVVSEKAGSECLIDEGVNGYIFNPESVDDLRNKMALSKQLYLSSSDSQQPRRSKMFFRYKDMFHGLCDMLFSL